MIVQRLTQERLEELKKQIRAERAKYRKIKQTIEQVCYVVVNRILT